MHVTFTPEDGERQEWDFDPGRVKASQAEVIERRFEANWEAWAAGLQSGNMKARRVLLWHLLVLQHAKLRFEDTPDFYADEMKVEFSVKELIDLRERMLKANVSEKDRGQALAALELEMSTAMERESGLPGLGKASSPSSPTDGGSDSSPSGESSPGISAD